MFRITFATLLFASGLIAAPAVVVRDDFSDGDPTGSAAQPVFWNVQSLAQTDNGVFENNGYLTLLAANRPYSFACLNSRLDDRLNFFRHIVSITIDDLHLEQRQVPVKEAMFRVSLNSTEKRQTASPRSVTLRIVPGVVFFGYKTAAVGKVDAENLLGDRKGSLVHELHDGRLSALNLTLDPFARPDAISYTLTLHTDGSRKIITHQGVIPLAEAQWSEDGRSALILEARRNISEELPDSYVSASLGDILVTSAPRP